MSDDIKFADGLYFNEPHQNAPDFVLGRLSIKPKEFVDWLRANHKETNEQGYINLKINKSRQGKVYVALDDWKPDPNRQAPVETGDGGWSDDEDIPF